MSYTNIMLQKLDLAKWPVWLRKPIVLSTFKRKKINSAPFATRCHGKFFAGDAKNMIDYHVLSRGSFEPGLTSLLNAWATGNPDGIFLDVGANVGIHILGTCSKYKKIIGLEPYPPLIDRLEKTLRINSIQNVEIKKFALSNFCGTSQFKIPDKSNLGTGRLVSEEVITGASDHIAIQTMIGDDLLVAETLPIISIKIDTEGAEKLVIDGLRKTLARDRPLVVFELLDDGINAATEIVHLFPPNYHFMRVDAIKKKFPSLAAWNHGSGDIAAIPTEKAHILSHLHK